MLPAVFFESAGQFYTSGNDPAQTRWRQINTENFKLIYPQEIDSLARRYLMTLEMMRPAVNEAMVLNTSRIPVVLHPNTVMSNGSVSWAPKSVNLFTSPNPYGDTQIDWQLQLSAHELRHVAQTEHFSKGFYRWVYPLFGEQFTGLGVGLFAASAYLEGDAVISETEFTSAGRGRNASFLQQIRADYLDGVYYNYERSLLGSYKRKAYDKYAMGFMMLSAERMRTGDYFYGGKIHQAQAHFWDVRKIFLPKDEWPFAGDNDVVANTQALYTEWWKKDLEARGPLTVSDRITAPTHLYCDYTGGVFIDDAESPLYGKMVAIRYGMEYSHELVSVSQDGAVKHLRAFNSMTSKLSDCVGGRIYWSETTMKNASTLLSYSDIKFYDVRSGVSGTLTDRTKYFNPAVSPDGTILAVAEYPVGKPSVLVLLSTEDGGVVASCPVSRGGQIQETAFCNDTLYATIILDKGVGIWKTPVDAVLAGKPEWENAIPERGCEIRALRRVGGGIAFMSDFDGVMNLYTLKDGLIRRETNSKYGVTGPFLDSLHNKLYFSEFDRNGYHLAGIPAQNAIGEPVEWGEPATCPMLEEMLRQRDEQAVVKPVPDEKYLDTVRTPSKRYGKLLHSFHVHSWAPVYYNVDRIMNMSYDQLYDVASLGATVYSQNDLGTVVSMLGYSYHNGFHAGHAMLTGKVLNCDLSASFDINDRKQRYFVDGAYKTDTDRPFWKASFTIDYPLNLFRGGWQMMLVPSATWNMNSDEFSHNGREYYMQNITVGTRFYRMRPVAPTAIYPRWGFSASAYVRVPLGDGDDYTTLAYFGGYGYLPGITRGQGLRISFEGQHHFTENRSFYYSSIAYLPRGYDKSNVSLTPTTDYMRFMLDYAIPIWAGDISIPSVLYFKRFQLIPFADFAYDANSTRRTEYFSYGTDLTVQFNIFRLRFEINAGVRFARTLDLPDHIPFFFREEYNRNSFSFIFGMTI